MTNLLSVFVVIAVCLIVYTYITLNLIFWKQFGITIRGCRASDCTVCQVCMNCYKLQWMHYALEWFMEIRNFYGVQSSSCSFLGFSSHGGKYENDCPWGEYLPWWWIQVPLKLWTTRLAKHPRRHVFYIFTQLLRKRPRKFFALGKIIYKLAGVPHKLCGRVVIEKLVVGPRNCCRLAFYGTWRLITVLIRTSQWLFDASNLLYFLNSF